jgi:hypothetical protein
VPLLHELLQGGLVLVREEATSGAVVATTPLIVFICFCRCSCLLQGLEGIL